MDQLRERPWQQTGVQLSDGDSQWSSPSSSGQKTSASSPAASQGRQSRPGKSPLSNTYAFNSPSALSNGWNDPSASHMSPLDSLARRGAPRSNPTQGHDVAARPVLRTAKSHLMEKAFALSRSTSVKRIPQENSPEIDTERNGDETAEEEETRKTIDVLRGLASTSTAISPSSPYHFMAEASPWSALKEYEGPAIDDGPGPQRFQESRSNLSPSLNRRGDGGYPTDPSRHMNNPPSSSFGFNDQSSLSRRDSVASVNTVRTAEFEAGGKWGRAWADRDDDEDEDGSLYGGSEWGGESDYDLSEPEARTGLGLSGGGASALDALRNLAKGADFGELTLNNAAVNTATLQRISLPRRADSQPSPTMPSHLQGGSDRARIVSLTPSLHQSLDESTTYFKGSSRTAEPSALSPSSATVQRSPYAAHTSTESLASLASHNGAHIFVYPPTPAGSETAHAPYQGYSNHQAGIADAASIHEWEAVSDYSSEAPASQRSSVSTIGPSAQQKPFAPISSATSSGPITVSSALTSPVRLPGSPLAQPRAAGDTRSSIEGRRGGGHPAGRPPPPPPPSALQYDDPHSAIQTGPRIGRARAAAIAAADGRESIVSDLDVETLRLDGSSRRDSFSTVGSRMSVGTVRYSDDGDGETGSGSHPTSLDLTRPSTAGDRRTPVASPAISSREQFASGGRTSRPSSAQSRTAGRGPSTAPAVHVSLQRSAASNPPVRSNGQVDSSLVTKASATKLQPASPSPQRRPQVTTTPSSRHAIGQDTKTGPSVAENYLSQGIQYHEQGDLSRSAYYFERSAKVDGGCVVGMCMWGMTLREGWGARKDPRKGFEWIQRAAAKAGELMSDSRNKTEADLKAIRSELKLSVYELGKCFCYGWGVKMDKKMALEYFELAAKLGDADAQAEAGALYAAGKGCKKDLKKAAKYYRMAAAQGYDLIGLSWVWKPKFDD